MVTGFQGHRRRRRPHPRDRLHGAHHPPSPSASPPAPTTPARSTLAPNPNPNPNPTATATATRRPTHTPLDRAAIERVFTLYMNGLADQDMTSLRRSTCPRLRSTLLGFAFNGYFVDRWELQPYEIPPGRDELSVEEKITRRDAETGELEDDVLNQWIIERTADRQYHVCGWLNEE